MSKKLIISSIIFILSATLFSQTPQKISYQAIIRSSENKLINNHAVGMKISILQGKADGTVVYTETQSPTTNAFGFVNIEIGGKTGFSEIDWSNGPYFFKTEIDPDGGTSYTITGISQILTVPYAFYAQKAGSYDFSSGIYLPHSFDPDENYIGTKGNFISFGHQGVSEDFIGYKNNRIYFKDSPDGADNLDPDIIAGGKIGIGIDEPVEKLEIDGNIDLHNHTVKNVADPVNDHDAATKAYVDNLKELIYSELLNAGFNGILRDVDGNIYKTIKIGEQVWMAENLKTTRYNDSTNIPLVTDNTVWINLTTPAYCWYNNTSLYGATYGALYNGFTVNTGKLCPSGWHVPTDEEWTTLINLLGGTDVVGGKLKEAGLLHWNSPNEGATNESGFTALPGGYRLDPYTCEYIGESGFWWTNTLYYANTVLGYSLYNTYNYIYKFSYDKRAGLSVRCIKD